MICSLPILLLLLILISTKTQVISVKWSKFERCTQIFLKIIKQWEKSIYNMCNNFSEFFWFIRSKILFKTSLKYIWYQIYSNWLYILLWFFRRDSVNLSYLLSSQSLPISNSNIVILHEGNHYTFPEFHLLTSALREHFVITGKLNDTSDFH